jgi:deferrochelatase/peroxidase EfeB
MRVDFHNVQGMLTQVFRYPASRHLLFRFGHPEGARAFLRGLLPFITRADQSLDAKPEPVVNLSITFNGLAAVGVDSELLRKFDAQYKDGPDPFTMGDVPGSRSDVSNWWDGEFTTDSIHCIVHVYGINGLEQATAFIQNLADQSDVRAMMPRRNGELLEGRALGGGKLHFGYTDGISQPPVAWDDQEITGDTLDFRHSVLGYHTPQVQSAPDRGLAADLVRDSSYLIFRWLYQDVAAFNGFLRRKAPEMFPHLSSEQAQELLAAKMLGRWRNGTPLVDSPKVADPTMTERNGFGYRDDLNGLKCPLSAHIRVVNPRDQELEPVAPTPPPRVLRRGTPYGAELNSLTDDGVDRGVIGLFICSDIERQFYTLTRWMKRNDFSPAFGDNRRVQDALFANRGVPGAVTTFTVPSDTESLTVKQLPDFVHTRGTAFLLLPSLSMLECLAR